MRISLVYLLLSPRSALKVVSPSITAKASSPTFTPAYSSTCHLNADGEVWVTCLSTIHFHGKFIRQVSCYTLLSGFRLPWPPSCCLDELTHFVVSDEHVFQHLNLVISSSRITSSAYQKWPTRDSHSPSGPIKRWLILTYLKFENGLRLFQPQGP